MKTDIKKLYEAMFLVDSADAASDWDGVNAAIKNILDKAEVEIISIKKWDERRLAYEIGRKSRGTYLICYFRSPGDKNQQIEREVQISDRIIRVLILNVDHMSDEDVKKDTPASRAEKNAQKASEEAAEKAMQAAKKAAEEATEKAHAESQQPEVAPETVEESAQEVQTESPQPEIEPTAAVETPEEVKETSQQAPPEETDQPEQQQKDAE